jgi:hypothetical protein
MNGFIDSNWAGSANDRRNATWICFSLSFATMSWAHRKQKSVALNTTEAEYIAACATWICFSLSFATMSWAHKKQKSVALNTIEAEYIAACDACTEAMSLCKLVSGPSNRVLNSTMIYCNDQSYVKISEKPVFHDKSKYIEIKHYILCDKV